MKGASLFVILLLLGHVLAAQTGKRVAFLPANSKYAELENRLADRLIGKFAGSPGLTVTDRQSIEKIIKEQNFQNSDRSSPDSAARIGKIAGAGQIVLVQVDAGSFTAQNEKSGNTTTAVGTVILQAHARMVDVETAAILAQPSSSFQDSAEIAKVVDHAAVNTPLYRRPASREVVSNSDPKVVEADEWSKAVDAVSSELGSKLSATLAAAPAAKVEPALVAGIANGSVYINEGSAAGIKVGDRFQVTRQTDTGLVDPKTNKKITEKGAVCVLTVTSVSDDHASGTCKGGLPQREDVAEPIHP
ncbi:MAG: FlgT C-terminal domain-containing protein [Candidatus Sulfotelmatobacter sp.]